MCVHMYVYMCLCMCVCPFVCMHVHVCGVCMRVWVGVYIWCMCVCACVCMCVVSLFISGQLLKGGLGHSSLDDLHGSRKEDEVYMHICVCERHTKKLGRLVPKIYLAD